MPRLVVGKHPRGFLRGRRVTGAEFQLPVAPTGDWANASHGILRLGCSHGFSANALIADRPFDIYLAPKIYFKSLLLPSQ
jgi:hypothetical protein